jgi:hypothetical protein
MWSRSASSRQRTFDQDGVVLDAPVQSRRHRGGAQRLTRKLKSYGAARKDMGLRIEHRQHKGLNNRAENSHPPTRRREPIMKRFKSPRQVQKFLSVHDRQANLFRYPATNSQPSIITPLALWPFLGLDRDRRRTAHRMTQADVHNPLHRTVAVINLTRPHDFACSRVIAFQKRARSLRR